MPRTISHPALQPLKQQFSGTKLLAGEFRDMVTVVVPREMIVPVCTFLRDDAALRYDMLAELHGVGGRPAGADVGFGREEVTGERRQSYPLSPDFPNYRA